MRDMTSFELERLKKGYCPICGNHPFGYFDGPCGGMMMNITTDCCNVRLNIVNPDSGLFLPVGQVLSDDAPAIGWGEDEPTTEPAAPLSWWRRMLHRWFT